MDNLESNKQETSKQEILQLIKKYADAYHLPPSHTPGNKINYGGRLYDSAELINLVDSALEFWLTSGRYTSAFEEKLAAYLKLPFCHFVNSGSSANLLAFMALTSPLLGDRRLLPGDEVITVAAGFPTTVAPIIQYGAVPVFLDVTIPEYNIDTSQLESAFSPGKTKAVMCAHTLGNPFDIGTIKAFCDKHHLWLIEDNCDALGSEYTLKNKTSLTGTFGDIGTSSFYPPHHMTTGEGGAAYTHDPLLSKIMRSMRDWGRDCACTSGQDNLCGQRFDGQFGQLPKGYDHKYVYSHFGYNLKASDMQAAIGVAQLEKLESFTQARRRNFDHLTKALLAIPNLEDWLILPEPCPNSNPSWFGYLITCRQGVDRNKLVPYLEENNIQTRMLFAGNILHQPCFDNMIRTGKGYRIIGDLKNTDKIMNDTFWLGVYPGINELAVEYMADMIKKWLADLSLS